MSSEPQPATTKIFFREAIARAMREAMRDDPRVILLGQDVGPFGGSYKEFVGLSATFGPTRVRDTPVAEEAMIGLGVGAAAAGLRPPRTDGLTSVIGNRPSRRAGSRFGGVIAGGAGMSFEAVMVDTQ